MMAGEEPRTESQGRPNQIRKTVFPSLGVPETHTTHLKDGFSVSQCRGNARNTSERRFFRLSGSNRHRRNI